MLIRNMAPRNMAPREGPANLRPYWEEHVHIVTMQTQTDVPVYELNLKVDTEGRGHFTEISYSHVNNCHSINQILRRRQKE